MSDHGVMPWDMKRLTPGEETMLAEYRQQLEQQSSKGVTPVWQRAR